MYTVLVAQIAFKTCFKYQYRGKVAMLFHLRLLTAWKPVRKNNNNSSFTITERP